MKKILFILLLAVLLVLVWGAHLLISAGQLKTINAHFSGTCKTIAGINGVEDITIHPNSGIAYLSACDRRALMRGESARGGIYAYDLNAANAVPVSISSGPGPDFQPHGISLFFDAAGRGSLFVINHAGGKHAVEIFDAVSATLVHRRTLTDAALISPNDIVAVAHDRFYFSNDHHYSTGILRTLEDYLTLSLSNIVYYDGNTFSEAASGIGHANGINVSPDGKHLYVTGTTQKALSVYDRDGATGMLTFNTSIDLDSGLDNIEMGPDGDLYIAAHPQLLVFLAHSKDAQQNSPSQILRVRLTGDGQHKVDEIYLNNGEELSGSSVAAVAKNRMLVGSVFGEKILDCLLDP